MYTKNDESEETEEELVTVALLLATTQIALTTINMLIFEEEKNVSEANVTSLIQFVGIFWAEHRQS